MEESQIKPSSHSHLCPGYDEKCKVFVLLNQVTYQTNEYHLKKINVANLSDYVSKGNNLCSSRVYVSVFLPFHNF